MSFIIGKENGSRRRLPQIQCFGIHHHYHHSSSHTHTHTRKVENCLFDIIQRRNITFPKKWIGVVGKCLNKEGITVVKNAMTSCNIMRTGNVTVETENNKGKFFFNILREIIYICTYLISPQKKKLKTVGFLSGVSSQLVLCSSSLHLWSSTRRLFFF